MLIRHRMNYWSCTKLANIIRGVEKPYAATDEDWKLWDKSSKLAAPVRYWIAEEGLDMVQNFLYYPADVYYTIKCFIKNYTNKTHCLTSPNLKRGKWYDLDYRILECNFHALVDFVESEKAHKSTWFDKTSKGKKQDGIDYLKWETTLIKDSDWFPDNENHPEMGQPTPQAEAAKEILALYTWWTETRPNRPDPDAVSGYDKIASEEFTLKFTEEQRELLFKSANIEKQYEDEDTEMLVRLMRVRNHLWT